jgi:two-component system NarL family response regulator
VGLAVGVGALSPDSMGTAVRVVIVEDNRAFRETLRLLLALRPEIDVLDAVASGGEAVEVCTRLDPDVAVIDYRMPGLNGAQTTTALRAASPRTRVVCLSASVTTEELEAVTDAGAVACLTKDRGLEEIVSVIEAAATASG